MKTILIATDFSNPSRNASVYALQLAEAMNAKVILFTAYQVPHPMAALKVDISRFGVMKGVEKQLADEAHILNSGGSREIDIICEEGVAHDAILAIAAEKEADLIIMGMKGGSRNLKKLFGSTTTSIIKDCKVPVLVVGEEVKFTLPKRIAYASDVFLDVTILPIDQIAWLTDLFNPKLFVVRVVVDRYEEVRERVNTPKNLRKELQKLSATFTFPLNENITDGLNAFLKEQSIDLLVMSPHKHEWFERIFVKSETKAMIFHSHLPLLALPDQKVKAGPESIYVAENNKAER